MITHVAPRSEEGKVDKCIELLCKAVEFCFLPESKIASEGSSNLDSKVFANKREEHDVIEEEDQVGIGFSVAGVFRFRVRDVSRQQKDRREGVREAGRYIWGDEVPVKAQHHGCNEKLERGIWQPPRSTKI